MTISEALAVFSASRWWNISKGGASLYFYRGPFSVRTAVKRKRGEALEAMIVRCADLATERDRTGYTPRWPTCAVCGQPNARKHKATRLDLCFTCKAGLDHGYAAEPFAPAGGS